MMKDEYKPQLPIDNIYAIINGIHHLNNLNDDSELKDKFSAEVKPLLREEIERYCGNTFSHKLGVDVLHNNYLKSGKLQGIEEQVKEKYYPIAVISGIDQLKFYNFCLTDDNIRGTLCGLKDIIDSNPTETQEYESRLSDKLNSFFKQIGFYSELMNKLEPADYGYSDSELNLINATNELNSAIEYLYSQPDNPETRNDFKNKLDGFVDSFSPIYSLLITEAEKINYMTFTGMSPCGGLSELLSEMGFNYSIDVVDYQVNGYCAKRYTLPPIISNLFKSNKSGN